MRLQLARAFDHAPAAWRVTLHDSPPADVDVVVAGPGEDCPGAIECDPTDPDALLETIATATSTGNAAPIVVVGASGGCGATTVALHLGAVSGACVIEGDPGRIRRRLDMPTAKTWAGALDGEPIELSALPVAPGLRVLLSTDQEKRELDRVVDAAARTFSRVVVVFGSGAIDLAATARIGVLVAAPTRPSAERAAEIVAGATQTRWAIVTNRTGPGSSFTRRGLEKIIGRRIAVELPCSPALRDAEDEGRLLTSPLSPWLWQIKRLWRALETA
jgi:hypothetical protein